MPSELKFLDMENQEININGLDLGLVRKGTTNISKVKIKNTGNITARDLILSADTLNTNDEVTEAEYQNQLLAKSWKSFSLKENGVYLDKLNLGDILPDKFVEGIKDIDVNLANSGVCIFKEAWSTAITEFKDETLIFRKADGEINGNVTRRMSCYDLGVPKDVEIEFNLNPIVDATVSSESDAMVSFPVRLNSNGDGKGYMFVFQYKRTNNRFSIAIYKDAKGLVDSVDRVYGTRIFDIGAYRIFDKTKKLGAKVYNNSNGEPTFEVMYDGKNLDLFKVGETVGSKFMSDTDVISYKSGGEFYFDINLHPGDINFGLSNVKIITEELEQPIFIKTILGDVAKDKVQYKSSVLISYIED